MSLHPPLSSSSILSGQQKQQEGSCWESRWLGQGTQPHNSAAGLTLPACPAWGDVPREGLLPGWTILPLPRPGTRLRRAQGCGSGVPVAGEHGAQLGEGTAAELTHFKLEAVDFDHPEGPKHLSEVGGFIAAPRREAESVTRAPPAPCQAPDPHEPNTAAETCRAGGHCAALHICRCPDCGGPATLRDIPGTACCATGWGQGPPQQDSAAGALPTPWHTHHAKSTQAYMMVAPRMATVVSSVCISSCRTPGKQTVRFCPL